MARKSGLGRGLSALIPDTSAPSSEDEPAEDAASEFDVARPSRDEPQAATEVPIALIDANPQQPRTEFEPEALAELAASIAEHGVIQPLLVSVTEGPDGATRYQLIAGERRLRAASAAGLTHVPVTVRETTSQQQLELAIIENVQRADLNAVEEALAYQRLVDDFGLTQREVAERVGRSRAAVANTLRLLDLSDDIRASLVRGEITEGHARALLAIADPFARREAWRRCIEQRLTVRDIERLAKRVQERGLEPAPAAGTAAPRADADTEALLQDMQRHLGAKVALKRSKRGSGTITIHFYSDDELEGVLERLLPR